MAVAIQLKDGMFFRIESVEGTLTEDHTHEVQGPYHIYKFHVRAKFVVPTSGAQVTNPKAHAAWGTSSTSQDMAKVNLGDPTDRWWKTTAKITIFAPQGTVVSVFVDATVITTEIQSGDIVTYTLPN